ncbi:hypothetical protein D3C87_460260 [compost metagenome]
MAYPVYPPYPGPYPQWTQKVRTVFHIEVTEETDYEHTFVAKDNFTYLPLDLSGYSAEIQVRVSNNNKYDGYSVPDVALDLNSQAGDIVLGTDGTITVKIGWQKTKDLVWNRGVYNLVLISPAGGRIQFANGFFSVEASPTKSAQTQLV